MIHAPVAAPPALPRPASLRAAAMALLTATLLTIAGCAPLPPPQGVTTIAVADAVLQPDGLPAEHRRVALNHRWDVDFRGRGGRAVYTLALPPFRGSTAQALLFQHVGNQVVARVNGAEVLRIGTLGDPAVDGGRLSHHAAVPAALLHAESANVLTVEASMQPLRHGGLWQVQFGPDAALAPAWLRDRQSDEYTAAAYGACLLLMGGLAAALWWRQRDAVYGAFALAALAGTLTQVEPLVAAPPLPWPLWGGVVAVAYSVELALIARFIFLVLGRDPPWLRRGMYAILGAVVLLAALSFGLLLRGLWTAALALLLAMSVVCFGVVAHEAWTTRRPIAWLLLAAGSGLIASGGHDFAFLRVGTSAHPVPELTPHALFLFVLILAGLFVARYSRTVAAHAALNRTLADRVAERERQLGDAFEALRAQREEQAVLTERQRIMREIHDGIGSQLVGLLGMVGTRDTVLQDQVRGALDEMRMAVDSLQPVHGDLTTVLATLRFRLQPRLQAAGIAIVWDVAPLPPLDALAPQAVLQLQRILLEAVTNVLKHAGATRVTVQARWRDGERPTLLLRLADDGVGMPAGAAPEHRGHGLANMAARAQAIGALLAWQPAPGGGTAVVIEWAPGG